VLRTDVGFCDWQDNSVTILLLLTMTTSVH